MKAQIDIIFPRLNLTRQLIKNNKNINKTGIYIFKSIDNLRLRQWLWDSRKYFNPLLISSDLSEIIILPGAYWMVWRVIEILKQTMSKNFLKVIYQLCSSGVNGRLRRGWNEISLRILSLETFLTYNKKKYIS